MICAAALFGVTGFFYSSAGGSDAVYVNQYPVYAGDTVTATINLGGVEKTLSGYNGVFVYDNDVFDVTEVVTEYGNTLWSTEVEDEVRFINVDSLEGIDISESAEILKVVLTVKETDVESINLGYKFNEIYSYDKETKLDTPMTDYKDLNITSMTLTFKSNQPEETETPVDENTQDETEGDVPEDNNQEGTEGDVPEDDNQEGTEGDVPENNSGDKNNAVTTDTPVPTKEASNSNNNESQNSTPTKVPQVNVSTEKPKVNVNSGTTSNSSSGSSTGGTATGGTATGSNSSGSSSSGSSSSSSSSSNSSTLHVATQQ